MRTLSLIAILSVIMTGCATLSTPTPAERLQLADDIAQKAGMSRGSLTANGFALMTYQRIGRPGAPLNLYIEGDGYAWKSRREMSDDPTPTDPLALRLAALDPAPNVAYVARPCQFIAKTERRRCTSLHWSTHRFSENVVAAMDQVITDIALRAGASGVNLIGYSGGGAVAALVAARRRDVISLRTVAGNLDHKAFTDYHNVTPLSGSLNAADYAHQLGEIPQRHFVGRGDKIVPANRGGKYIKNARFSDCIVFSEVKNASHITGWAENWPILLRELVVCASDR